MPPSAQSVEMRNNIPPELDVCSEVFDAAKALNCKNILLPYPKSKTYNNLAEYYSRTFNKKKNEFESDRSLKSSKNQHFVLKRNYAWYYWTLGLDLPEDFDDKSLYCKYTKRKRNSYGKYKVDRTAEVKEMLPEMLQPIRSEKIVVKHSDGTLKKYIICKNKTKIAFELGKEDCCNVLSNANNTERVLESTSLEKSNKNTLPDSKDPLLGSEGTDNDKSLNKTAKRNPELSVRPSSNSVCDMDGQIILNTCRIKRTRDEGSENEHVSCSEKEKFLSVEGAKRKLSISPSNEFSDSLNLLSGQVKTVSPSSEYTCSSITKVNNCMKKEKVNGSKRRCGSSENIEEKIQNPSLMQSFKSPTTVSHDVTGSNGKEKLTTKRKMTESYNSESKKARTDDMAQSVQFISNNNLNKLTNRCRNLMQQNAKTRSHIFASKEHNSKCKHAETVQDKKSVASHSKTDGVNTSNGEQKSTKKIQEKHFDTDKREKSKHFAMTDITSKKFKNSIQSTKNNLTHAENNLNTVSCTKSVDLFVETHDFTGKETQSSKRKVYNTESEKDKVKDFAQVDIYPVTFRTENVDESELNNKALKNKSKGTCSSPLLSNDQYKLKPQNIEMPMNVDDSKNCSDARVHCPSNNEKHKIARKEEKLNCRNKQRIEGAVMDILPVSCDNNSSNMSNFTHNIHISIGLNKLSKLGSIVDSSVKTGIETTIMKQKKVQRNRLEDVKKKNLTNKDTESVKSANAGSNDVIEIAIDENLSSKDDKVDPFSAVYIEKSNLVCNNLENIQSSENCNDISSVLNLKNDFILKMNKSCSREKQATERKGIIDSKSKEINTEEAIADVQPFKLMNSVCNITNDQTHKDIENFSEKSKETCSSPLLEECQSKCDTNKNIQNVEISDNVQISSSVKEFCDSKYNKEKALLDLARKAREELRAKMAKRIEQRTDKTDAEVASGATKGNMNCESTTLSTINTICDNSVELLKVPSVSASNKNLSEKMDSPVTVSINLNLLNLPSAKQKTPLPEIPVLKERNSSISCSDVLVKDHKNTSNSKRSKKNVPDTNHMKNRKFIKMI